MARTVTVPGSKPLENREREYAALREELAEVRTTHRNLRLKRECVYDGIGDDDLHHWIAVVHGPRSTGGDAKSRRGLSSFSFHSRPFPYCSFGCTTTSDCGYFLASLALLLYYLFAAQTICGVVHSDGKGARDEDDYGVLGPC